MIIPVKCPCEECPEWALIELQGSLEVKDAIKAQVEIGSLCLSAKDKQTFHIGYHELEGKRVPLKNPFLVLEKHRGQNVSPAEAVATAPRSINSPLQSTEYAILGVIRHKYHFKNRPTALISKPAVRGKKIRISHDAET